MHGAMQIRYAKKSHRNDEEVLHKLNMKKSVIEKIARYQKN